MNNTINEPAIDKKTILITGSNAGIGFVTAKHAAIMNQRIILACRSKAKAEKARWDILQVAPDAEVFIRTVDLASFDSIRSFATTIKNDFPLIHVLVNNAGIFPMKEQYTREGFEMQFGVNYLGHFLLTHLLMPLLCKSPDARIIHVSSIGHLMGNIRFDTFRGRKHYLWGTPAYGQSKLANVLLSNELSRRAPRHITNNAVHPGYVDSDFFRNIPAFIYNILRRGLVSAEHSGKYILEMGISSRWEGKTGQFVSVQGPLPISKKTRDLELGKRLYLESCRLTSIDPLNPIS